MARTAPQGSQGAPGRGPRRAPLPPAGNQPGMFTRRGMQEVWGELRKVQWPTFGQVVNGTLIVGVVTAVFALYLTGVDALVEQLVNHVLNHLAK